jgi:hypothetical protein
MISYIESCTRHRFDLLAFGIDRTRSRNGTNVAIYSPADNPHLILVIDINEWHERFEQAEPPVVTPQ